MKIDQEMSDGERQELNSLFEGSPKATPPPRLRLSQGTRVQHPFDPLAGQNRGRRRQRSEEDDASISSKSVDEDTALLSRTVLSQGENQKIYINKKHHTNFQPYHNTGTSKKSKMQARQEQIEQSRLATAQAARKWFRDHRVITQECDSYGHVKIRTEWASSPDSSMAARQPDPSHVRDIAQSYVKFGVQDDGTIVIVVFAEDIDSAGLNRNNFLLRQFHETDSLPVPMHTIVGDHRIQALQALRKAKPNNESYKFVEVTLVICSKSAHNKQMALTYGTLDNQVQSLRKKAEAWDCICQVHRQILDLRAEYGVNWKNNTTAKDKWRAYKMSCNATMCDFKTSSLGNFFTIANTFGELWNNIAKVFINDREATSITKKGKESSVKKKALGYGWLCHMADIPNDELCAWTSEILAGDMSTKDFKNRCLTWKQHVKVQKTVIAWYNMEYVDEASEEIKSYHELGERFPFLLDPDFFHSMLMRFPTKGKIQVLPDEVARLIRDKMKTTTAVLRMLCFCYVVCRTRCRFHTILFCLYKFFVTHPENAMFSISVSKNLYKQKYWCKFPGAEDHW